MKISKIRAEESIDSRKNPTVKVTVFAGDISDSFSVPSGASTGLHEARELRERLRLNFTKQRLSAVRGQIQAAEKVGNLAVMQERLAEWKKLSQELRGK